MVDQASGRNVTTQNNGLFNFYKNRSYQCTVQCLGNALLQPTMYFNLRNVPMFYGPYFITEVNHNITAGKFETTFTGTRQSIYSLPSIDSYLQSVNQNLLTKVESIIKNSKDSVTGKAITNINKSDYITQSGDNTRATINSCSNNLSAEFQSWGDAETATSTNLTPQQLVDAIKSEITDEYLQVIVYLICYAKTFNTDKFYVFNNNFANVTLTTNLYGESVNLFEQKKYTCVEMPDSKGTKTSQPIALFKDVKTFIGFMSSRLNSRVDQIINPATGLGITKFYVCEWPVPNVSQGYFDENISRYSELEKTFNNAFKTAVSAGLNKQIVLDVKKNNEEQIKKIEDINSGKTNP
jgi:hypothetical protein